MQLLNLGFGQSMIKPLFTEILLQKLISTLMLKTKIVEKLHLFHCIEDFSSLFRPSGSLLFCSSSDDCLLEIDYTYYYRSHPILKQIWRKQIFEEQK